MKIHEIPHNSVNSTILRQKGAPGGARGEGAHRGTGRHGFSYRDPPMGILLQATSFRRSPTGDLLQAISYRHSPTGFLLQAFSYRHSPIGILL